MAKTPSVIIKVAEHLLNDDVAYARLLADGYITGRRSSSGKVFIVLPPLRRTEQITRGHYGGAFTDTIFYALPSVVTRDDVVELLIEAAEIKGSTDKQRHTQADVVCGKSGKKLFAVERSRNPDSERHPSTGYFLVPRGLIVAHTRLKGRVVRVERWTVDFDEDMVTLRLEVLFFDKLELLPEHLEHYRAAAVAALEKSRCKGCSHIHFASNY